MTAMLDNGFFVSEDDSEVNFIKEKEGKLTSVIWHAYGRADKAVRISRELTPVISTLSRYHVSCARRRHRPPRKIALSAIPSKTYRGR